MRPYTEVSKHKQALDQACINKAVKALDMSAVMARYSAMSEQSIYALMHAIAIEVGVEAEKSGLHFIVSHSSIATAIAQLTKA